MKTINDPAEELREYLVADNEEYLAELLDTALAEARAAARKEVLDALRYLHETGGAIFDADNASHNEGPTDLEWARFEEALQGAADILDSLSTDTREEPSDGR